MRRPGDGGLMGRVLWSDRAEADLAELESNYPGVTKQLKRCAGRVLHPISPRTADPAEEGIAGEIMWHRGDGHGDFMKRRGSGPQDFFLFYRRRDSAPGSVEAGFEILAVRSIHQVAGIWLAQTDIDPPDAADAWSL
jgi:hypothetical protein